MVIVHLRELKCPLCGGKDLEELEHEDEYTHKYRCKFCGVCFTVDEIVEGVLSVLVNEGSARVRFGGDDTIITCPYCKREIYLWVVPEEDTIGIVAIKSDEEVLKKVKIPPEDEEEGEEEIELNEE